MASFVHRLAQTLASSEASGGGTWPHTRSRRHELKKSSASRTTRASEGLCVIFAQVALSLPPPFPPPVISTVSMRLPCQR